MGGGKGVGGEIRNLGPKRSLSLYDALSTFFLQGRGELIQGRGVKKKKWGERDRRREREKENILIVCIQICLYIKYQVYNLWWGGFFFWHGACLGFRLTY